MHRYVKEFGRYHYIPININNYNKIWLNCQLNLIPKQNIGDNKSYNSLK